MSMETSVDRGRYKEYGSIRDKEMSLIKYARYLCFCFIIMNVKLGNPLPMYRKDVFDRYFKALYLHSGRIIFLE